ncbi:MAG: AF1514 family protein [Thiobacillus sp.]|uniref:AF1514 family protein n=1 Tax=Thiobacillus sp. TaxID=924 RepID=UPI0027361F6F|nr:AF1514 family protein [Thiobacillus sp.]MDP3585726.1 AF1514 family protein [Thiobacillus sp.]
MQTITLADMEVRDFSQARRAAVDKAGEVLARPTIVAWKDDKSGKMAPEIPGGKGDRWHDYGESNEGVLELQIGKAYHFIFTDADGFTEPDMNLATLDDNGKAFLCLNDACTEEDKQKLGYFPGGGMGG